MAPVVAPSPLGIIPSSDRTITWFWKWTGGDSNLSKGVCFLAFIFGQGAIRFGFTFEGVFRQHMIQKRRSRDTAWFSIIDSKWQNRKKALEEWL